MLWILIFSLHRSFREFKDRFPRSLKHPALIFALFALPYSIHSTSITSSNNLIQDTSINNTRGYTCYLTSGLLPSFFQHHKFWDLRFIPSDDEEEEENNFTLSPPSLNNTNDLVYAPPTSSYPSSNDFTKDRYIQNCATEANPSSPILCINSAQNVYMSRNTTSSHCFHPSDPPRPPSR